MPDSLRKLIGTVLLLVIVAVYSLVMMVVAERTLPHAGPVAQLMFYAIAGLAWVPLAAFVVWWMYRSPGSA